MAPRSFPRFSTSKLSGISAYTAEHKPKIRDLNNVAKDLPNSGWYYIPVGNAKFIVPDTSTGFVGALEDDKNAGGKFLSLKFDISDTGFVMIGTRLGLDTGYYDLSRITAVRMRVRGDCNFYVTLEHYKEVEKKCVQPNSMERECWRKLA